MDEFVRNLLVKIESISSLKKALLLSFLLCISWGLFWLSLDYVWSQENYAISLIWNAMLVAWMAFIMFIFVLAWEWKAMLEKRYSITEFEIKQAKELARSVFGNIFKEYKDSIRKSIKFNETYSCFWSVGKIDFFWHKFINNGWITPVISDYPEDEILYAFSIYSDDSDDVWIVSEQLPNSIRTTNPKTRLLLVTDLIKEGKDVLKELKKAIEKSEK